jgi:hypothetical protein
MTHRFIPSNPPLERKEPAMQHAPTLTITPTDPDEFELLVAYHDKRAGVIASQTVDLGPGTGGWMSPSEQADAVAATVRTVWASAWTYYTGDVIEP